MNNIKRIHSNLYFVEDLEKTADFYKKLGFNVTRLDDVVRIKIGDFTLAFMNETENQIDRSIKIDSKGLGISAYIEVEDVDKQFIDVSKNGINPTSEPTSYPWGKREFVTKDPDGFKIIFYQKLEK